MTERSTLVGNIRMDIQEKEPAKRVGGSCIAMLRRGFPTKFMVKLAIIYAAIIIIYGIIVGQCRFDLPAHKKIISLYFREMIL